VADLATCFIEQCTDAGVAEGFALLGLEDGSDAGFGGWPGKKGATFGKNLFAHIVEEEQLTIVAEFRPRFGDQLFYVAGSSRKHDVAEAGHQGIAKEQRTHSVLIRQVIGLPLDGNDYRETQTAYEGDDNNEQDLVLEFGAKHGQFFFILGDA